MLNCLTFLLLSEKVTRNLSLEGKFSEIVGQYLSSFRLLDKFTLPLMKNKQHQLNLHRWLLKLELVAQL